jgi:hypothetical protein
MSWLYEGKPIEDPQGYWGFVYIITNLSNNKKYIGKKQFYFKKYKTVKGKRKGYLAESDWKCYFGSSETLKEEVSGCGEDNFKREILKLCKSKSECTYWETKYQFEFDVLLKPEEYYNEWIMARVRRSHLIKK